MTSIKNKPMKPIPVYLSVETIKILNEMKWTERIDRGVIMRQFIAEGVERYQKSKS